jgi:hypothetical protein
MAETITLTDARTIESYRDMAESCRRMAAASRRPGPLILRAEAYEASARALEQSYRR